MKSRMLILLSLIIMTAPFVWAENMVTAVNAYRVGDEFITEINFEHPVKEGDLTVDYINQTVQVEIEGAKLIEEQFLRKVKDDKFKSVYSYMPKDGYVRVRIIQHKPHLAKELKDQIKIEYKGHLAFVKIKKTPRALPAKTSVEVNEGLVIPPIGFALNKNPSKKNKLSFSVDEILTNEIGATPKPIIKSEVKAEKPKSQKSEQKLSIAQSSTQGKKNRLESEIPIFTAKTKTSTKASNPYFKMIISLLIVGLLGGGITLFTKWWSKKQTKSLDNNKIRVLTQHHLGPKKSLAIIQVAGESILIGVTDQNINMIKTLALLDEEVPEISNNINFKSTLEASVATDNVLDQVGVPALSKEGGSPVEDYSLVKIKDIVSNRLKDMRTL